MKGFTISISAAMALAVLLLGGCNDAGQRGCLGGGAVCNPSSTLQISTATVESNSSNASSTSSGFTCTATPSPAQVYPYQWLQIAINVTGGAAGNKIITNFDNYVIPSFSNSATIVGEYYMDKAGTVVQRTIDLQDSAGNTTSCDFQVTVLPYNPTGTPPPVPACTISVQESGLKAGDTAHFTFNATNTNFVMFNNLYGSSNWRLDDSVIQRTGATQATAALTYSYAGPKTVSIMVTNAAGVSNTCSTSFVVGATSLSVTQTPPNATGLRGEFNLNAQAVGVTNNTGLVYSFSTADATASVVRTGPATARVTTNATTDRVVPVIVTVTGTGVNLSQTVNLRFAANPPPNAFTGCSAFVSPVGAASQAAAAVSVNAGARVVIFPQGGVGPFTAGIGSVTQNGISFGYALDTASSDPQQVNFHFTQVGTPMVTVYLRDLASNVYQFCSTYAVSQ